MKSLSKLSLAAVLAGVAWLPMPAAAQNISLVDKDNPIDCRA